jgi:aspartyl-tRNA synthetase
MKVGLGRVALCVPGGGTLSRKEIDDYGAFVTIYGAKGLAYIKVNDVNDLEEGLQSPIVKFLPLPVRRAVLERTGAQNGDLVFFGADKTKVVNEALGALRCRLGADLNLYTCRWAPLWVVDFPLMSYDEAENRYVATHHPFTAPVAEDAAYLDTDPKKVRGQHYDVVLNGMELGGGSIRIHQPALQKKVFEDVLKIPADVVESRFGYMLKAFTYGAPPHGGIAFGLDRMVALLCGTTSIRDVIAFPKTQKGQDLMAQSPTPVTAKQLKELHIATVMPE